MSQLDVQVPLLYSENYLDICLMSFPTMGELPHTSFVILTTDIIMCVLIGIIFAPELSEKQNSILTKLPVNVMIITFAILEIA